MTNTSSNSTTLWSTAYVDHVFTYTGQSYETRNAEQKNLTLYGINELARKNRLVLCRRQISNRDVRILIENPKDVSSSKNNSKKNYEKFLYNFNKLSMACYLTALQSSDPLWSLYSIPTQLAKDTNFYVIESSPTINERYIRKTLSDEEFLTNYMETIHNLHMGVSNCLHKNLNRNLPMNSEFIDYSDMDDESDKEMHLFRSFRLLGLRHPIGAKSGAKVKLDPFNEIVEVRCAFDIRQFNSRTSYDCFIECEISYFKIVPDNLTINEQKWMNYLNSACRRSSRSNRHSGVSIDLDRIDEQYENDTNDRLSHHHHPHKQQHKSNRKYA